jgi:hypothetical protein
MEDRFKDAKWYVGGGDELNTIIYDASDLEGDGPDGHGMVCESATPDDARLIAAAPTMREALVDLIEQIEAYERLHGANTCAIDPDGARAAIARAEGPDGGYARLLDTDPKFEAWVRGCVDKAEGRA